MYHVQSVLLFARHIRVDFLGVFEMAWNVPAGATVLPSLPLP